MKRICTICARAGSTRLKNKNIYPVRGVPLLAYSIAAARESGLIDHIVVTSESPEYLEIAKAWGADSTVERPVELAQSNISKTASIAHAVAEIEAQAGVHFETIIDLDVTAPLRRRNELNMALKLFEERNATALISAVKSKVTPFSNMFFQDKKGFLEPMIPADLMQEHTGSARECYALNASIYAWRRDAFMADPKTFFPETVLYEMMQLSRYDIDTKEDLDYVEHILGQDLHDLVQPVIISTLP